MTVAEAFDQLRAVTPIRVEDGRVRYTITGEEKERLSDVLAVLRGNRETVYEIASQNSHLYGAATDSQVALEARRILNRTGVRIMEIDGEMVVGIWSDLDGPDTRRALEVLRKQDWPVRYLDGPEIPDRYKLRTVTGEPRYAPALSASPVGPAPTTSPAETKPVFGIRRSRR
jgi:hypothetical protein